jgi:adenylosuccinate synthase
VPVSVVVGGQYGSEGKGKVALELVRSDRSARIAVRPGGTNSGHTAYTRDGKRVVVRQLPAAAIDGNVRVVLPAGSYIDVNLLRREMAEVRLPAHNLVIDPRAHVIRADHVHWEQAAGLLDNIGSTGSGTGAAVLSRIGRGALSLPHATFASEVAELLPYLSDAAPVLDAAVRHGDRIVVEGTQGFGLSPIHGDAWPKCTSRDTTASAFLAESGLSPRVVDQVVLVIRSHPIRVAGDSGPLRNETTWESIAARAGAPIDLSELTSVTQKLRRVGLFDAEIVRRAIMVNSPTQVVLNHLDYVDWECRSGIISPRAKAFLDLVERELSCSVDLVGTSETNLQKAFQLVPN